MTSVFPRKDNQFEAESARLFATLAEANRLRRTAERHEGTDLGSTPNHINFSTKGNSWPYRLFGWGNPELSHTWTIGAEAILSIPSPAHPEALLVNARLTPLCGPGISYQTVQIEVAGTPVGEWVVHGTGHYFCIVWPRLFGKDRIDLRFAIPGARSPHEIGLNNDSRVLGLMFHDIWLSPLTSVSI